jgi:hypothetical protein
MNVLARSRCRLFTARTKSGPHPQAHAQKSTWHVKIFYLHSGSRVLGGCWSRLLVGFGTEKLLDGLDRTMLAWRVRCHRACSKLSAVRFIVFDSIFPHRFYVPVVVLAGGAAAFPGVQSMSLCPQLSRLRVDPFPYPPI